MFTMEKQLLNMREGYVIAAMLDTGDSFLHLQKQDIDTETAEKLDYNPGKKGYEEYVEKALETGETLPNYHSLTEKLMEEPSLLYENNLLRHDAEKQIDQGLKMLEANRERSLNDAELNAVVSTAMKDTEVFPRKAIDKGKVLENLNIEVYVDNSSSFLGDEPLP